MVVSCSDLQGVQEEGGKGGQEARRHHEGEEEAQEGGQTWGSVANWGSIVLQIFSYLIKNKIILAPLFLFTHPKDYFQESFYTIL